MSILDYREQLAKTLGNGFITADEISNSKRAIIPISPAVDIALNGGLLTGTVSIFAGSYKTGKSTTAFQAMKNAIDLYDFPCAYIDIEGRGGDRIFSAVKGIDRSKILIVKTTREKIYSAEDFLAETEKLIETVPNIVIVMDSISRLYTRAARDDEVSGTKRSPTSKLLSDFISRISGIVPAMNSTLICIAQTYDNISGYGAKKLVSGGNAVQFQNDTSMIVKSRKDYEEGAGEKLKRVGNILEWDVENVPIGAVPTHPIKSYIRFGYGCDNIREVLVMATDLGLIKKSGAWYQVNGESVQGEDRVYKYLEENPEQYTLLWNTIKDMCLDPDQLSSVCKNKEEFEAANQVSFDDEPKKAKKKKKEEDEG